MKRFGIGFILGVLCSVGLYIWMQSGGKSTSSAFAPLEQTNEALKAQAELLESRVRQTDSLLQIQIQATRQALLQIAEKKQLAQDQMDSLLKAVARADKAREDILDRYRKELEKRMQGIQLP